MTLKDFKEIIMEMDKNVPVEVLPVIFKLPHFADNDKNFYTNCCFEFDLPIYPNMQITEIKFIIYSFNSQTQSATTTSLFNEIEEIYKSSESYDIPIKIFFSTGENDYIVEDLNVCIERKIANNCNTNNFMGIFSFLSFQRVLE